MSGHGVRSRLVIYKRNFRDKCLGSFRLGVCCYPLHTLLFDLAFHPSGHQHIVLAFLGGANDQFQEFLVIVNRIVDQREIR